MTKFVGNCGTLYPTLAKEAGEKRDCHIEFGQDNAFVENALGVKWSLKTDSFGFSVALKERPMSKRGILAIVGSVYDPFGLISPYVLVARQLLRELCRSKIGWDEDIPESYKRM